MLLTLFPGGIHTNPARPPCPHASRRAESGPPGGARLPPSAGSRRHLPFVTCRCSALPVLHSPARGTPHSPRSHPQNPTPIVNDVGVAITTPTSFIDQKTTTKHGPRA